ncbi:MAG: biotin/lipoate A/B protein ligase family protein, partial [Acetanaerobacterium sp.]
MITKLKYLQTVNTVPYNNLATEAYLLESVPNDTCILYLWQNRNTVVIGKNQNAWKECRISELESDDVFLVRRLSGGGAVYHDLGNLNFTFLVPTGDYDVSRQLDVILKAVGSFGLKVQNSGRNDIVAENRKFSGNAFYHSQGHSYHHGTLLVNVDMGKLSRYLNVSLPKLQSKGVDSVKARVVNLSELCSGITIDSLVPRLIQAFGEVYNLPPTPLSETELDKNRIAELTTKFSSWEWRFGRKIPFTWQTEERFTWG